MPLYTLTLTTENILIGGGTGGNLIYFTVPTTSSRPSIEMSAFNMLYIYFFFSVDDALVTPLYLAR